MATKKHSNKNVYSYFCLSDVHYIELSSYIELSMTIHDKHGLLLTGIKDLKTGMPNLKY
jgi:hypothetical protein